jgi:hypothetical protein
MQPPATAIYEAFIKGQVSPDSQPQITLQLPVKYFMGGYFSKGGC